MMFTIITIKLLKLNKNNIIEYSRVSNDLQTKNLK